MTLAQRLHDELTDYLSKAGSEARIVHLDVRAGTVLLRGDEADYLLAKKPCERVGLRILKEQRG